MTELTEREKELLGYVDKLLKFHSLFMQAYFNITQVVYNCVLIQDNITESVKKIDPFNTMKNMIESLNVNFGTDYKLNSGEKREEIKQ